MQISDRPSSRPASRVRPLDSKYPPSCSTTSMISAVGIRVVGTLSDAHDFSLT